jgi:hypothetical protein
MKKSLLFGIIGLAAGVFTAHGQGYVTLDNYSSGINPPVTYWTLDPPFFDVPANGVSGAGGEGPLSSAWTVGLYYIGGTVSLIDPPGYGIPIAPLVLATGPGSTAVIGTQSVGGNPGYFDSIFSFNTGSTLNTTITAEVVVYPTVDGSYANATYRIHSAPFTMPTVAATSGSPIYVGDYMTPFTPSPEPTTLALTGLGLGTLLMFRRKNT